jgi:hypothetical protein
VSDLIIFSALEPTLLLVIVLVLVLHIVEGFVLRSERFFLVLGI